MDRCTENFPCTDYRITPWFSLFAITGSPTLPGHPGPGLSGPLATLKQQPHRDRQNYRHRQSRHSPERNPQQPTPRPPHYRAPASHSRPLRWLVQGVGVSSVPAGGSDAGISGGRTRRSSWSTIRTVVSEDSFLFFYSAHWPIFFIVMVINNEPTGAENGNISPSLFFIQVAGVRQ